MKAIFILLDSMNRNYLPIYGNDWVKTPNIERLAQNGVVFDNHWIGSAPCMPARRDILTGRLNFLERGWGAIEPMDTPFPRLLRKAGIRSHMETDHYHYFHVGGENYHTQFDTYAFHRGQENDAWQSRTSKPEEPEHYGIWSAQYEMNREKFKTSAEFSTPKTFNGAVEWMKNNEGADDYVLWIEGFDPHEPFDCAPEYLEMYNDQWDGARNHWTSYNWTDEYSPEALQHLRNQYAGTLTQADEYLGRLFDEMERQGTFDDALIILTTDHGHLIGEHGASGKNRWHVWNELGNIPFVAKLPGCQHAGERRDQLTQNIDVMPTLMDFFDIEFDHPIHGETLKGVLENNDPINRQAAIYGWFGMPVNVTDGKYTYFRAAERESNDPLLAHYQIPTTYNHHDVLPTFFQNPEIGQFLPWTKQPVFRCNWNYMKRWRTVEKSQLYNIESDPGQENDLAGTEIEKKYIELLRETMKKYDAPPSQFERLGLK